MQCWRLLLLTVGAGVAVVGNIGEPSLTTVACLPRRLGLDLVRLRGGTDLDEKAKISEPTVSAFEVKGRVDYDKLVRDWGSQVPFNTGLRVLAYACACTCQSLLVRTFDALPCVADERDPNRAHRTPDWTPSASSHPPWLFLFPPRPRQSKEHVDALHQLT